ncbi:MAG: biotin/lipoyl-binding protein [Bacteroidales bacterium]|nr:biotin/lipoyl-binding protein [Bacteroidales bacterium]
MSIAVSINKRTANIELLSRDENKIKIKVDEKTYDLDIVMVENGVYSLLHEGKSYNVELIQNQSNKKYIVNTLYNSHDVEIIDAESKYLKSRKKDLLDEDMAISSPMPGKVVKILVEKGNKVKAGETVIVVSAMKMESEYKVKKDRIIKDILVKEGDIIDGNQPLVLIE